MKNLMKRIISTALSVCMLITMFSMLGTISVFAAESDRDSGNMPLSFFEPSFWLEDAEDVGAYKLADGSTKFSTTLTKEVDSFENSGFDVMFKHVGGFELIVRANSDNTEGYNIGVVAPRFGGTSTANQWYIRRANGKVSGVALADARVQVNDYFYNTWCKLSVRFYDRDGATEIEVRINDAKIDFYLDPGHTNTALADEFKDVTIRNGNLVDYAAPSTSNAYMTLHPYYNGGFESSPNRENQFYFASIDKANKVLNDDQFVSRIAVIGDSITQGVGASNYRKTSYVALLQKKLGPNYDVFNAGASACTAMEGTYKPYKGQVIYYAAQLFNPDHIIFALGSNDGQSAYWDRNYFYGPAHNDNNNNWRSVDLNFDEEGNPLDTVIYDTDGTTVLYNITVTDGVPTCTFTDPSGTQRSYELSVNTSEPKFIAQANELIDSFVNNPYWGTNENLRVVYSSALETWAGIKSTWDRQQEVFDVQKKVYEQNDKIIGFVDNRTLFSQYNEDKDSDMYYRNISDDALHPNDAGFVLLADNIYNVIKDVDFTTEPRNITYNSYKKANTNVAVRELNNGQVTPFTNEFFTVNGKGANADYTNVALYDSAASTLNYLNLGYKFDATFNVAYKGNGNNGDYDASFTDYQYAKHMIYSFGDIQLRSWRYKGTNGALSFVYGLFYKNKLVGDYKYVEGTNTNPISNMGEKLTYTLSFDKGNVTVSQKSVTNNNYNSIASADTSSAESVEIFSYTAEDLLAACGAEVIDPINKIRFSASATGAGNILLVDAKITSDNDPIEYNIQTTEGGSIYADGVVFDNTATRCVGDEATLKAVLDDEINYRFNSWQDSEGNVLSKDTEYYVAFVGGEDIIAVFDKIYYSDYAISATEGGSILMDGEAFVDGTLYEVGLEHTITAVAEDGYTFAGWIDENEEVVTFKDTYTFKIPSEITLKAVFVPTVAINSLNVEAIGGGSVDYDEADTYIVGSYLTLKAVSSKYYKFNGWYDENDNLLSTKVVYNYVLKADNDITAKFEFAVESDFTVTAKNGTVTVDGAAFDGTKTYNAGEVYTLNATANEGYTFAYWRVNDKIASYDAEYVIRLEADADVEAVFTSESASGDVTVSFVNREGAIVSSVTVASGSQVTLPAYPTIFGYTVDGWNVNGTVKQAGEKITANADMIIMVNTTVVSDTYTVTVVGSVDDEAVSGEYTYNTKLTVEFDVTSLVSGEFFGGWADANGAVISYEETYVFFVGADVTVSAVIADEAAAIKPVVAVTDVTVIGGGKQVSFLTQRTTPAGYKYVESGVLYTANSELASNMTLETLAGGIKQKAAAKNTKDGQYRLTLASREGTEITAYLRAYLTYIDKNGEYVTIYSNVYSGKTVADNAPDIDTGIEEGEDDF